MTDHSDDVVEFDERVALALAALAIGPAPRPIVKTQLMARIAETRRRLPALVSDLRTTTTGCRTRCPAFA